MSPEEIEAGWWLRGLATAHLPALAFHAACQHDLFTHIEAGAENLAEATGLNPEALAYLLEAMAGLGLLTADYRCGEVARKMLVRGAPLEQLEVLAHNRLTYERLTRWQNALLAGHIEKPPMAPEEAEQRLDVLDAAALMMVDLVLPKLRPLRPDERVLDLGGGAGTFLRAFGRECPRMRGWIYELAPLAGPLRERLSDDPRLEVVEGNYLERELPAASLVLMSHILNYLRRSQLGQAIAHAANALEPGGRLAVHDIMLTGTSVMPAVYSLRLMGLNRGQGHSVTEVRAAMEAAGLVAIELHEMTPEPAHMLVARKTEATR